MSDTPRTDALSSAHYNTSCADAAGMGVEIPCEEAYVKMCTHASQLERELRAACEENRCDACAGTGKPVSGLPCMCAGSGKMSDAARYLRAVLLNTCKERDNLKIRVQELEIDVVDCNQLRAEAIEERDEKDKELARLRFRIKRGVWPPAGLPESEWEEHARKWPKAESSTDIEDARTLIAEVAELKEQLAAWEASVCIGELVLIQDYMDTMVFAEWNEEKYKQPAGTKLYARRTT